MRNTLILLAGYPGTGKTFLANLIMERFPSFQLLSPDLFKEKNWDEFGFENLNEKEKLIIKSWQDYYEELASMFHLKKNVISDYPFSEKQKSTISELVVDNNYQVITIRLIADLDVLFERQKGRDLDDSRHLGHILKQYHPGIDADRRQADHLVDYQEFMLRCTTRGYGNFSLGYLLEVDVTDFSKVNYDQVISTIEKLIE